VLAQRECWQPQRGELGEVIERDETERSALRDAVVHLLRLQDPEFDDLHDLIELVNDLRADRDAIEYSVDQRGFIPEGWVAADEIETPYVASVLLPHDRLPPLEDRAVDALLASSRPGDLFGALALVEESGGVRPPGGAQLGPELVRHPDSEVRARAVAVIGRQHLAALPALASDPSHRVRMAALVVLAASGSENRATEYALALPRGADRAVALAACDYLSSIEDLDLARRAFLRLVEARDR
jgi:hypothetical protein